jgi:hypothetical protein
MGEIEIGFLTACQEYANRQHEMLPQIAVALGVEPSQVFYTWMLLRRARPGKLADADWTYFFHGYECDLRNQKDGRCLRVDFGPKGRVGILDSYGILRFIMMSIAPWPDFSKLKAFFATGATPCGEHSGDREKMRPIWDRLENEGFVEHADPTLMALMAKHTTRGSDGLNYLCFPPEITEELAADCKVAHRFQLSQKAVHFLKTHTLTGMLGVTNADIVPA